MITNFAQIHVSLVADGIYALLIIRGKTMQFHQVEDEIARQKRFWRLVDAWHAADHYGMFRSREVFARALESMGGRVDASDCWHDEQLPGAPIDGAAGADMAAGWEV
jgi:hypothetical protein